MKAVDQAAKVRLQITSQPKKILHSSVKEAKLAVSAIESNYVAEIPKQTDSSYLAPWKKMRLDIEEDDAAVVIRLIIQQMEDRSMLHRKQLILCIHI